MRVSSRPILFGLGATILAALLLWRLGAPTDVQAVHGAAALVGIGLALALSKSRREPSGPILLLIPAVLFAVEVVGIGIEGVERWVQLGPLALQPALILLPLLFVGPADRWRAPAIGLSAIALFLHPDAGSLMGLAGGTVALAARRPSTPAFVLTVAVIAAATFAWLAAEPIAPVAFVEGIAEAARERGPAALAAFAIAALLLFAAPLSAGRDGRASFGFYAGLFAASMLAAYPVPVLGASPSAMLGFWLAIGFLRR